MTPRAAAPVTTQRPRTLTVRRTVSPTRSTDRLFAQRVQSSFRGASRLDDAQQGGGHQPTVAEVCPPQHHSCSSPSSGWKAGAGSGAVDARSQACRSTGTVVPILVRASTASDSCREVAGESAPRIRRRSRQGWAQARSVDGVPSSRRAAASRIADCSRHGSLFS